MTTTQTTAILEAIAYLIDRQPQLTPAEIRNILIDTIDELGRN